MLKSIELEKYKSFKENTPIELAPLTLLCGVNSSGKSSILKSLLMMKQTIEKESTYNKLSFIGNYVDNGYFDDIVNFDCKDDNFFTIQNEFTLCKYNSSDKKRQDMVAFKEFNKLYSPIIGKGKISKFIIKHYVKVEKSLHQGLLSYIDNNNVTETRIEIKVYNKEDNELEEFNGYINLRKVSGREYTLTYSRIPDKLRLATSPLAKNNYICYFNNIKLINIFKDGGISSSVLDVKPTIMQLFNTVSSLYTGIKFLAPLRQFPSRFYTITGDVDSVGIYGENAPVLLAKLQNEYSNTDISTPLKVDSETGTTFILSNYLDDTTLFIEQVQNWLDYLDIGRLKVEGPNGQISVKFSGHNISDVGFGISQVLPIIVQGLSMQKDQLLLLEQPEIHLHPKMQMRIADFLISLAHSERNLIVETHSDHIINRIVRRVVEYSGTKNDISRLIKILFVYKDTDNSSKICEEIEIDPIKGLINCPPEFFDQYGNELRNIMSEGFENLKHRGQAND